MSQLKKFKSYLLVMLLFTFVAAVSLSSCRDQKKKENTEVQSEHPEGEEQHVEDEHPAKKADEHPAKDSTDHPTKEEGEHPEG